MRIERTIMTAVLTVVGCVTLDVAQAQHPDSTAIIFENVRIFDGTSDQLSAPSNVLVVGNVIKVISSSPIADPPDTPVTRLRGDGRTLMPGLIDAHTHIMLATVPQAELMTSDFDFTVVASVKAANDMLMRGFTSIRDLGGPVFGLKRGIDRDMVPGPRIWPSGAFISQTGGHGDFRMPAELHAPPTAFSFPERVGVSAIADDAGEVRKRARAQLALGATQIKLMAGGGVSSMYDPIDVVQYTVPELRAAVEAAENWGTYVTVHAYTPRSIRQAIEAGVKCIEHGQLIDEQTAKLMAEKEVWWSLQPFIGESRYPEGSINRAKQLRVYAGTDVAYKFAKKYGIKTAWGTDILFSQERAAAQGEMLTRMLKWYTAAETLKMATSQNAELLGLSGPRNPYPGRLGVVEEGALADLLVVDGDPLENLELLENPSRNIDLIMKDGKIYKNKLP